MVLVIISENYRAFVRVGWYSDNLGTAALWVENLSVLPVSDSGRGNGFVWIRYNEFTIMSVYLSPNEGMEASGTRGLCSGL